MNGTQKNNHKQTAVGRVFSDYTKEISKKVINNCYKNQIVCVEEIGNTWRKSCPVNEKNEQFIIDETNMFIIMLPDDNGLNTNPMFLMALIREISDYLSAYFVRDGKHKCRNQSKKYLWHELYDNSAYIQKMLCRQAYERTKTRKQKMQTQVAERKRKQQYNQSIADQVQNMFRDAQKLR